MEEGNGSAEGGTEPDAEERRPESEAAAAEDEAGETQLVAQARSAGE
jgi:hypothetical protein